MPFDDCIKRRTNIFEYFKTSILMKRYIARQKSTKMKNIIDVVVEGKLLFGSAAFRAEITKSASLVSRQRAKLLLPDCGLRNWIGGRRVAAIRYYRLSNLWWVQPWAPEYQSGLVACGVCFDDRRPPCFPFVRGRPGTAHDIALDSLSWFLAVLSQSWETALFLFFLCSM